MFLLWAMTATGAARARLPRAKRFNKESQIAAAKAAGCWFATAYITPPTLSLADGVSLYGSCVFDETSYLYRSTIMGNPAVQAKGIKKPTVIQGFVILGSSAVHTAEASVAITVNDCSGLVFRQDVLASGKGGSGGNGNTPAAGTGATGGYALNAVDGAQGGNACYLSPPSGTTGKGGKGANRNQIHSSWGLNPRADCKSINDSLSQTGNSSGSVIGGVAGGRGTAGCACQGGGGNAGDGGDGGAGKMGGNGAQGGSPNPDTKGGFAGTIWRPNSGITGTPGQVGSGGGGGGSGGSGAVRSGQDGSAGRAGAAEAAVVVVRAYRRTAGWSFCPARSILILRSGLADANVIIPGPGGQGGKGGAGSGGAGGNGGPSFGIALVNSSPVSPDGLTIYAGQPGAGGELGPGGQNDAQNKGADGKAGMAGFSNNSNPIVSYTSSSL